MTNTLDKTPKIDEDMDNGTPHVVTESRGIVLFHPRDLTTKSGTALYTIGANKKKLMKVLEKMDQTPESETQ